MSELDTPVDPRRHLRPRKRACLLMAAAAICALAASAILTTPVLVWNSSLSSPPGLYIVAQGALPRVGAYVVAWPPPGAGTLAAARGYLPHDVPLVKTVAAAAGDQVCARRDDMWVNGRPVARRRSVDDAGRKLPRWFGCRVLRPTELLLLGLGDPRSFDGRYFGPIGTDRVIGRAQLVWRK